VNHIYKPKPQTYRVLGEEFERYLPAVLPSLLRSAAISPNMKVEDEEEADEEEFDGMQTVQVSIIFFIFIIIRVF
jgi:hypothetical protein